MLDATSELVKRVEQEELEHAQLEEGGIEALGAHADELDYYRDLDDSEAALDELRENLRDLLRSMEQIVIEDAQRKHGQHDLSD